jgi:hypothetical protein
MKTRAKDSGRKIESTRPNSAMACGGGGDVDRWLIISVILTPMILAKAFPMSIWFLR